nr:trypsin-like peptidase domain-containing protein [Haladaptatus sp. W1]
MQHEVVEPNSSKSPPRATRTPQPTNTWSPSFIWADVPDRAPLEAAFSKDDSVAAFQLIGEFETDCLYQLEWEDHIEHLVHILVEHEGSVLRAIARNERWELRLLFAERELAACTNEYCLDHDTNLSGPKEIVMYPMNSANRIRKLSQSRRAVLATVGAGIAGFSGCTEQLETVDSGQSQQSTPEATGEFSDDTRAAAQKTGKELRQSVVKIIGKTSSRGSQGGTGWCVDGEYIITNGHVVEGSRTLECWTLGGESFTVEIIDASLQPDVAVLRPTEMDSVPIPSVTMGDEGSLEKNQPLLQVGHPYAIGNWVISLGRYVKTDRRSMLTTVPAMSGSSGSPLTTTDGAVVGLTTGATPVEQNGRVVGEAPKPVEPQVYEVFHDQTYSTHVPATEVRSKIQSWTS